MARVLSVGTAVPERRFSQAQIRAVCEPVFAGTDAGERMDIFERAMGLPEGSTELSRSFLRSA